MATELTVEAWDEQFTRQGQWTQATRTHLYRRANLLRARRVLDVGCGTGAVTEEIATRTRGALVGLDLDPDMIAFARQRQGRVTYQLGDAHALPFPTDSFEVTTCHFVLMWCHDAHQVAREMVRVTRPGGTILACAEPDYGGRIDYPDMPLAQWQQQALRSEGADPCLGRKIRGLFALPGVQKVDMGLISGLWDLHSMRSNFDAEWALWSRSLEGLVPTSELAKVRAHDWEAIETGSRLVFMPVFSALVRCSPVPA